MQCNNKDNKTFEAHGKYEKFFILYSITILFSHSKLQKLHSLGEKCPYSESFWSAFSRIRTECRSLRIHSECGKMRTRITPNTHTF